ncbi:alginate O-acetyltransferase AlgX-related protein [Xanthobacter sediminis]
MPLLMSFRRYWAIFVVAVLCLPTIGFLAPDLPAPLRSVVAPEARWWTHAATRLDPYINNAFGFRGAVLAAHAQYGRWIGSGKLRVLKGEDGALFIKEDQALEQSLGQMLRPQAVAAAADTAARLEQMVEAWGGRFLVMSPPNAQTVNFDLLPAYARALKHTPTEYDLFTADLKARGVPFLDLRPLMADAKTDGPVYRRIDTHWNERGALLAFNAAMDALGRPDLKADPAEALGAPVVRTEGDLVRMAGLTKPEKPDIGYQIKGPMAAQPGLKPLTGVIAPVGPRDPFVPQAFETGHAGPRIMVIGDSFTQGYWKGLLASRASAYAWIHHRRCRFDFADVERFKPDILIYAPTERMIPCLPPKE